METLRYADEVKKAQSYFNEIPDETPSDDLLDLATTLIEKKSAPFEPGEFHDRYVDALRGLIEKKSKAKGKKILEDVEEPESRGSNVIDLMAALKKSVGGGGAAKAEPAKKAPAKKTVATKASAEEPAAKKAPVKKAPAKKAPAKPSEADAPAPRARKRA